MVDLISLVLGGCVLACVFRAWENKHLRENNDKPYSGPIHSGTRVLHTHAHIVERGHYRALVDFGGHRLWVPHCGYSVNTWEEGVRVDPLVFRQVSRGL